MGGGKLDELGGRVKGAELFAACLEEEGVECIFAVPGEENLDLLEALRTSRIRLVVTRHEQHAAFMAATWGRLTGRAGVCLATLGPGATNLLTGIAHAQLGGMPFVAITGQKPRRGNWEARFQQVDVVGAFQPLCKWNTSIVSASVIPTAVRHAFKIAEDERPGATHLELPEDAAAEEIESMRPHPRVRLRRPVPDDKAVDLAADLIRRSRRPLVLIGAGANRKRVGRQLAQLVEKTGIYAVSTQMGKGVLPEDHPQSLFAFGIHKKDWVHRAIADADLVITVGYTIVEYPPFVWNEARDKTILHVDFSVAEPDAYYSPSLELLGDISYSLWALHSRLGALGRHDEARARLREFVDGRLHGPVEAGFPIGPRALVQEVRSAMGREDVVSLDNGIFKIWFARAYRAYAENSLLLDNALATMGAGLAAAMTAKMLLPERRVLAVCGDGGFLMNGQDLETAVRLRLPIVILIVRDDAYGFIKWKQADMGFPEFGMAFGNPDFVLHARSFGAPGLRLERGERLSALLERAFDTAEEEGLPVLVDCPIDYSENAELSRDHLDEAPAAQD
jgi:acetolactate synthase I/II/III large subunit